MKRAIWAIVLFSSLSTAFAQSKPTDPDVPKQKESVKTEVKGLVPTPEEPSVYSEYKASQEAISTKLDALKKTKEFSEYQAEVDRANGILERFAALLPKGMQFDEISKTIVPVPQQVIQTEQK